MQSPRNIYPAEWFDDYSEAPKKMKTKSASEKKRLQAALYTVRQLPSGCKLFRILKRP